MPRSSLKACPEGIEQARRAMISKQLTHDKLAELAGLSTRDAVTRFFAGDGVDPRNFVKFCEILELNWQSLTGKSNDDVQSIDELVQTARDKIRPYIESSCGTMRVLTMTQPIGLDDIYTKVNILEKITKLKWLLIEEIFQNVRYENFDRIRFAEVHEKRVPGLKAVEKCSKLMILGKPGAGKTTFLKHIALQCINGNFESNRVPLFVTLKSFALSGNQPSLLEYLAQLFDFEFKDSQVVEQLLKQGKLLILLDGLDEVQQVHSKRILNQIKDFTDKYYQNKFVITCRIAAHEYIFDKFTDVEIADFDDEQVETFVLKWFTAKNDKSIAEEFISALERNKPIQELATSPILLTLLCLVFEQISKFPQSHAELYSEGIDILLEKWDTTRGVERDQLPYKNLSPEQRKDLLIQIAYPTFEDGKYFFKPEDVEEYIKKSLNIKDNINTKKILQSIEAQHGLLIERTHGIYSFSHLTFHEYFTARKIQEARNDELLHHLCTHITKKRWREVFLLVAGLMRGGTDQLLLLMEKQARSYINTPKLQALLRWAHKETTGSAGDIKLVGKRAVSIAIAYAYACGNRNANAYAIAYAYADANAIAYAYTYTYAYTYANANDYTDANANAIAYANAIHQFITYAQNLEKLKIFKNIDLTGLIAQIKELKKQIPDDQKPKSVRESFSKCLFETWLHAFNLTPEMVKLSFEEIEALNNYLYANRLIIECSYAAVSVAPETWLRIEDRMLRID